MSELKDNFKLIEDVLTFGCEVKLINDSSSAEQETQTEELKVKSAKVQVFPKKDAETEPMVFDDNANPEYDKENLKKFLERALRIASYELQFNSKANFKDIEYLLNNNEDQTSELEIQKTLNYTLLKKSFDEEDDIAIVCLQQNEYQTRIVMGVKNLESNKHQIVDEHLTSYIKEPPKMEIEYLPCAIALHPEQFNIVAVGTTQGIIQVLDLEAGKVLHESQNNTQLHQDIIMHLHWRPSTLQAKSLARTAQDLQSFGRDGMILQWLVDSPNSNWFGLNQPLRGFILASSDGAQQNINQVRWLPDYQCYLIGTMCGNLVKIASMPQKSNKINTHEDIFFDLKNQGIVYHKGFSIFVDSCISKRCATDLKYQISNYIRQTKIKEIDVKNIQELQIPLKDFQQNPINLTYDSQATPILEVKPLSSKTFLTANMAGEIFIYHINNVNHEHKYQIDREIKSISFNNIQPLCQVMKAFSNVVQFGELGSEREETVLMVQDETYDEKVEFQDLRFSGEKIKGISMQYDIWNITFELGGKSLSQVSETLKID